MGIDTRMQQAKLDAQYNPNTLAKRYKESNKLEDLLAMQDMTTKLKENARSLNMQMQQNPDTIYDQLQLGLTKQTGDERMASITPGLSIKGDQSAAPATGRPQPRPSPAQQGIAATANTGGYVADGGIVGYAGGGVVKGYKKGGTAKDPNAAANIEDTLLKQILYLKQLGYNEADIRAEIPTNNPTADKIISQLFSGSQDVAAATAPKMAKEALAAPQMVIPSRPQTMATATPKTPSPMPVPLEATAPAPAPRPNPISTPSPEATPTGISAAITPRQPAPSVAIPSAPPAISLDPRQLSMTKEGNHPPKPRPVATGLPSGEGQSSAGLQPRVPKAAPRIDTGTGGMASLLGPKEGVHPEEQKYLSKDEFFTKNKAEIARRKAAIAATAAKKAEADKPRGLEAIYNREGGRAVEPPQGTLPKPSGGLPELLTPKPSGGLPKLLDPNSKSPDMVVPPVEAAIAKKLSPDEDFRQKMRDATLGRIDQDSDAERVKEQAKFKEQTAGTRAANKKLQDREQAATDEYDTVNAKEKRKREILIASLAGGANRSTFGSVGAGIATGGYNARNAQEKTRDAGLKSLFDMTEANRTAVSDYEKEGYAAGKDRKSEVELAIDKAVTSGGQMSNTDVQAKVSQEANVLRAETNNLLASNANDRQLSEGIQKNSATLVAIEEAIQKQLYEGAYSIDYAKYRKIASDKDSSEKEVADAKQKIASIEAQVRAGYQTAYDTATSSIRDLEEKRDRKTAAINVDGYKVKEKPTPAGRVGGIASLSDNLYAPLQ